MSPVGKFFVVLNLVLAGLFVGSAANLIGTSGDYRAKLEAKSTEMESVVAERDASISDLEAQLGQAQGARDRASSQRDQKDADVSALNDDLETERRQNADLRERLSQIEAKLGNLEDTNSAQASRIDSLSRSNTTLREERDSAMDARDSAVAASTASASAQSAAERNASDLNVELRRSQERAAELDAQLKQVVAIYKVDLADIGAQPMLEGSVLSVEYVSGTGFVVINLGDNDGVMAGHTFDVYNGSSYKGRIYVEKVNTAQSAATVQLSASTRVEAGDRITTRL